MNINVIRDNKKRIVGFIAKGHVNYKKTGSDIFCAAVSALLQSCHVGINDILKIKGRLVKGDGYFKYILPDSAENTDIDKAYFLLETVYRSLLEILKENKKNSEYIFIEEVFSEHSKNYE